MDAKLQQVEKDRAGSEARLSEQLQMLATSISNLERALQTPHVRGGWGEVQLRRTADLFGMPDGTVVGDDEADNEDVDDRLR